MNWWGGVMFAESQPRQQICTEEYTGRWNERAEERAPGPKRTSHALVLGTTGGRRSVVRWKLLEASFHVGFPCSYEGRPHSCWAAGWCEITGAPLWEAGESKVCRPGSTARRNPGESPQKTLGRRALCIPGPLLLHGATIPRISWRPQRPWPRPDTENQKPRGPGLQQSPHLLGKLSNL